VRLAWGAGVEGARQRPRVAQALCTNGPHPLQLHGLRLQHTLFQVLPVDFSLVPAASSAAGGGRPFRVMAKRAPSITSALNLGGQNSKIPGAEGKALRSINGAEPVDFLQGIADRSGTYHDKGLVEPEHVLFAFFFVFVFYIFQVFSFQAVFQ